MQNSEQNEQITSVSLPIGKPDVVGCFSLEREELNPFVKPANKHGNNGGSFQSGRRPTRWKEVKFLENVSQDEAIKRWSAWINESGWRIVNWNNGQVVAGGRSRF